MHPVFILAFVTFLLLAGFLVWNVISTKRHRFNRDVTGPGGSNDPLSGKTEGMRNPDEMRAALGLGRSIVSEPSSSSATEMRDISDQTASQ